MSRSGSRGTRRGPLFSSWRSGMRPANRSAVAPPTPNSNYGRGSVVDVHGGRGRAATGRRASSAPAGITAPALSLTSSGSADSSMRTVIGSACPGIGSASTAAVISGAGDGIAAVTRPPGGRHERPARPSPNATVQNSIGADQDERQPWPPSGRRIGPRGGKGNGRNHATRNGYPCENLRCCGMKLTTPPRPPAAVPFWYIRIGCCALLNGLLVDHDLADRAPALGTSYMMSSIALLEDRAQAARARLVLLRRRVATAVQRALGELAA